jgi:hypothetical protein
MGKASSSAWAGFGGVRALGDRPRVRCGRPGAFAEDGGDQVAKACVEGGLEGGLAGVVKGRLTNELDELWSGRSEDGFDLEPAKSASLPEMQVCREAGWPFHGVKNRE